MIMAIRNNTAWWAFVLGCSTAGVATLGFLYARGAEISSPRMIIGDKLSVIGLPGFVLGGMLTGGHRTAVAAMAISGTIINAVTYLFLWLVILKVASMVRNKSV
jgi:hypothetical protein